MCVTFDNILTWEQKGLLYDQMKEKRNRTIGATPRSNIKLVERGKHRYPYHKYMTAHFPWLEQALQ